MQEWLLRTREDRLTLGREWPQYGRDAWGISSAAAWCDPSRRGRLRTAIGVAERPVL